jgi:hypothetical protein
MYPNAPLVKRHGEVNAWDNAEFRKAVQDTGKKQLIVAGITTDVMSIGLLLPFVDSDLLSRSASNSLHSRLFRRDIASIRALRLRELSTSALRARLLTACAAPAPRSCPTSGLQLT